MGRNLADADDASVRFESHRNAHQDRKRRDHAEGEMHGVVVKVLGCQRDAEIGGDHFLIYLHGGTAID